MAKLFGQANRGLNELLNSTEGSLSKLLDNPYVSVSLKVFLGLYAAFVSPRLPKNITLLLDTTLVRVIFAALIVYTSLRDPVTSILLAIVFIVTLQTAAKYRLYDTSLSVLAPGGISWLPSAKVGAVVDERSKISEKIMGGLKNLAGSVVDSAQNVGGGVVGGVQQVGTGVLGGVQHLGGSVVGGVQQLGGGLVGGVQQLGGGLAGGVQQLGGGVVGGVQTMGSGLVGGLSRLGGCLVDSAQEIGSGLVSGAQQVGSGLVGSAQQVGGGVAGSVQQLGSGLVGGVQQLGSGVTGSVQHLGSGVAGGVQQLGTGVMSGVRSLGEPLGFEHMENMNIMPGKAETCAFAPFTTEAQFNDAESNFVPGADQSSCVQTFKNQFCIQGFQSNMVQGY